MSSSQIARLAASALLPSNTLIPLSHVVLGAEPVFVNCKQYQTILRRREKKRKLASRAASLHKTKYKSRSLHAQRRARTDDGKFLGKKLTGDSLAPADAEDSPLEPERGEPGAELWTDGGRGVGARRSPEAGEKG